MSVIINTIYAEHSPEMDDELKFKINLSNKSVDHLAQSIKDSNIHKLDPNDGREFIITLTVNPQTGSIDIDRQFTLPN